jgi:hypothetical protein
MSQERYDNLAAEGNIDATALYLTPEEEVDLSGYATAADINMLRDDFAIALKNAIDGLGPGGVSLEQHLREEDLILDGRHYGDTLPEPGIPGRIFFKKV